MRDLDHGCGVAFLLKMKNHQAQLFIPKTRQEGNGRGGRRFITNAAPNCFTVLRAGTRAELSRDGIEAICRC